MRIRISTFGMERTLIAGHQSLDSCLPVLWSTPTPVISTIPTPLSTFKPRIFIPELLDVSICCECFFFFPFSCSSRPPHPSSSSCLFLLLLLLFILFVLFFFSSFFYVFWYYVRSAVTVPSESEFLWHGKFRDVYEVIPQAVPPYRDCWKRRDGYQDRWRNQRCHGPCRRSLFQACFLLIPSQVETSLQSSS